MTDKECFIIMPISTPVDFIPAYNNDPEHFLHVMKCLFKPAIEKAGFKAILPVIQGSEIIHGEIISKIESSDLVLCDMSILNPNVFFELGIRTALNKPVCLVKDNVLDKVPFDTNIINYHVYSPDLSSWVVKSQVEKLANHISESFKKSNNCNSLWKYFSLRSIATPPEKLDGEAEKIEYLTMQVDAIRKQLNESLEPTLFESPKDSYQFLGEGLQHEDQALFFKRDVIELLSEYGVNNSVQVDINTDFKTDFGGTKKAHISSRDNKVFKALSKDFFRKLEYISSKYGIKVTLLG